MNSFCSRNGLSVCLQNVWVCYHFYGSNVVSVFFFIIIVVLLLPYENFFLLPLLSNSVSSSISCFFAPLLTRILFESTRKCNCILCPVSQFGSLQCGFSISMARDEFKSNKIMPCVHNARINHCNWPSYTCVCMLNGCKMCDVHAFIVCYCTICLSHFTQIHAHTKRAEYIITRQMWCSIRSKCVCVCTMHRQFELYAISIMHCTLFTFAFQILNLFASFFGRNQWVLGFMHFFLDFINSVFMLTFYVYVTMQESTEPIEIASASISTHIIM